MALITEDHVEQLALGWFRELGYTPVFAPDIAPDGTSPERSDYRQVVLTGRLRAALARLNPHIPPDTLDDVVLQVATPNVPGLLASNRQCHQWLTQGVKVTFLRNGETKGEYARLLDYENPSANDWLVVNQLSVKGAKRTRRPDIVVYVNGLPLAVIELKNTADPKADIWKAFQQLQTYKEEIPEIGRAHV